MSAQTIQIGAAARRTGLSVDAIRFYERQRLVRSRVRTEGGFRLFENEDVEALQFIKSAQQLGFSLQEIRDLLALRHDQAEACPRVHRMLETKLTDVREKIASLRRLETELQAALEKCTAALAETCPDSTPTCPVLLDISAERSPRRKR